MRHPSAPNNNGQRARTRGAIRTHLGRKRVGPRARPLNPPAIVRMEVVSTADQRDAAVFDRLMGQLQSALGAASERTAAAIDGALDIACNTLVAAGEFTADNAVRLREYLRRDLMHREQPTLTFRTGDITSAGSFTCTNCGWTLQTSRTSLLPPCPRCADTTFGKTG